MTILFISNVWSDKFPEGNYPLNSRLLEKYHHNQIEKLQIEAPSGLTHLIAMTKLFFGLIKRNKKYDRVIIGYNNMFFTGLLTRWLIRSKQFTTYFLYSKWYTFVKDYNHKLNFITKKLLYWSDLTDLKTADLIWFDTKAHREMLTQYFPIIKNKQSEIEYVHTNYELFNPKNIPKTAMQFKNRVFFHGGYIPLQGTPIITQAINELSSVYILMIGRGHDYQKALSKITIDDNFMFVDSVPYGVLPQCIYESGVCLGGPFGNSEKAKSVITNKTFEYLAVNKKTIVGDTPANKELLDIFPEKKHLIYFCKIDSVKDLKNTILKAMSD